VSTSTEDIPRSNSSNLYDASLALALKMASIIYSKKQWKQDAALIIQLHDEITTGGFPHLINKIIDADLVIARTLLKAIDATTRQDFMLRANDIIHSPNSSTGESAAFQRFMDKFRNGPPEEDVADPTPESHSLPPSRNFSPHHRHRDHTASRSAPRRSEQPEPRRGSNHQGRGGFYGGIGKRTGHGDPDDDDNGNSSGNKDDFREF
jgi:hypothetical protein